MALVDYSDSDTSDGEGVPVTTAPSKSAIGTQAKPTFQKVVDRSNPHKIRVNLPNSLADEIPATKDREDGPAPKRARTGGAFSGFNSFLPAPKRIVQKRETVGGSDVSGRQSGLQAGISLKTASNPGFSREAQSDPQSGERGLEYGGGDVRELKPGVADTNFGSITSEEPNATKTGSSIMFKPLSVARNPQKRRAAKAVSDPNTSPKVGESQVPAPKPRPKVPLFSFSEEISNPVQPSPITTEYEPLLYEPRSVATPPSAAEDPASERADYAGRLGSQTLDSIAADLNLSEAAKRQLFGRQRGKPLPEAVNVINFNIDEEYAANEQLRQAGETVQHNPVRAIAPGKHSLKQLVNAASNQKDALEEHFATGGRNRKEAGSRYGW